MTCLYLCKIHKVKNITDDKWFDLIHLKTGEKVTVKQLWDMYIESAWQWAEPGIFNGDIAFNRCTVTNINKKILFFIKKQKNKQKKYNLARY